MPAKKREQFMPKMDDLLSMYLDWGAGDVRNGTPLPKYLKQALLRYGKQKADFFDRRNAIMLVQQVEDEGFAGDERFDEVAARLNRFVRKDHPNGRLVKSWWDEKVKAGLAHLVDDRRLVRRKGRPKSTGKYK